MSEYLKNTEVTIEKLMEQYFFLEIEYLPIQWSLLQAWAGGFFPWYIIPQNPVKYEFSAIYFLQFR